MGNDGTNKSVQSKKSFKSHTSARSIRSAGNINKVSKNAIGKKDKPKVEKNVKSRLASASKK
jgi:hypothetical protein